jgi:hypothetical protein
MEISIKSLYFRKRKHIRRIPRFRKNDWLILVRIFFAKLISLETYLHICITSFRSNVNISEKYFDYT